MTVRKLKPVRNLAVGRKFKRRTPIFYAPEWFIKKNLPRHFIFLHCRASKRVETPSTFLALPCASDASVNNKRPRHQLSTVDSSIISPSSSTLVFDALTVVKVSTLVVVYCSHPGRSAQQEVSRNPFRPFVDEETGGGNQTNQSIKSDK